MNKQELEKLILDVTTMIKEKARYISQEEDLFKYILAEKELEHLKEYLQILRSLQKKLNHMTRIDLKDYEEKIEKIRATVKDYYEFFTVEDVKRALDKGDDE